MARKKITTPDPFAEALESLPFQEDVDPTIQKAETVDPQETEVEYEYEYVISAQGSERLRDLISIVRDQTNEIESIVTDDSLGEKESAFKLGGVYAKLDDACTELEDLLFLIELSEEEEGDDDSNW